MLILFVVDELELDSPRPLDAANNNSQYLRCNSNSVNVVPYLS